MLIILTCFPLNVTDGSVFSNERDWAWETESSTQSRLISLVLKLLPYIIFLSVLVLLVLSVLFFYHDVFFFYFPDHFILTIFWCLSHTSLLLYLSWCFSTTGVYCFPYNFFILSLTSYILLKNHSSNIKLTMWLHSMF